MTAEIRIKGRGTMPLVLSAENYVDFGNDSIVFRYGNLAIKLYPDITLKQLQGYQKMVNCLSDRADTESWNLQISDGSQVPLRINPILQVSKSPFEGWPVGISPWVGGEHFIYTTKYSKRGSAPKNHLGYFLSNSNQRSIEELLKWGYLTSRSEKWFEILAKDLRDRHSNSDPLVDEIVETLKKFSGLNNIDATGESIKLSPDGILVTDLFNDIKESSLGLPGGDITYSKSQKLDQKLRLSEYLQINHNKE